MSVLHARLQLHLQDCVNLGNVPEWIVKRRTVLIQKDAMKGTQADNYRPFSLPTHNVETTDWNHGREAVPAPGEEWNASR